MLLLSFLVVLNSLWIWIMLRVRTGNSALVNLLIKHLSDDKE